MADELEDNLLLEDNDSIAGSGGVSVDGDDAFAVAGIASDDDYHASDEPIGAVKQRHERLSADATKEERKRKRKQKERAKKQQRAALAAEFAEGLGSVATQPPDMQADYLGSKQRATYPKLSSIELDELRMKENMLVDTTSFDRPRKEESLAAFVRKYAPETAQALSDASAPINMRPGRPGAVVLTGNAQRAADLAKALRALDPNPAVDGPSESSRPPKKRQKQAQGAVVAVETPHKSNDKGHVGFIVGKLFARHFKLKEHQTWLQQHACPLAAGTPQRVASLISSGDLKLDSLEVIVVDQTWVDAKQRTVLDTPETRDELIKLLASDQILAALRRAERPVKLALF
ncbi:uncharacterized protein PFL1_02590 [Pseudozyma flocculosa PF-1]|uniref:Uncharacterized protein n=1 Tax=Pseudozyma flocculosa PF-1 TaxID=1277687 RepID=A0A061HAH5_9BASI|nr:uncharacterized protein PFL1_02590 [Pseudozyma flocculosa PF-1]EPQ29917.1 hypothetical protein PFL1_02590 [Pseudozyma flocculosa PF-1]